MVKIEESFVKKTRAMMEVPAEERRKARIEKAKSSMPDLVSLYVSAMYLKERELKTSSTGAVFWKEPYVDYNGFLDSLVKMLYDLGDSQTWHPEGKLIFKVDEAINEASIRDEATRAPIVYMKDMPEHLTKIMQRQDPNGSGFFGKMVDAFMRRLLEQSLIEAIRTNLWKDLEDKDLFESVNLGLAKKSRIQAQDKDAVESFSDFVDLDLPSGNLWARKNLNAKTETDVGDYLDFNAVRDLVQDKRFVPEGVPSPPTGADFDELIDYCTSEYTTYQGKRGYMFTSQTNGEKIFFPFGGSDPGDVDYSGWYWSAKEFGYDEGKFLWMNNRQYNVGYADKAGKHNVRLVLRKYQVDLDMYESASNLGLVKKTRVQAEKKDAVENISIIQFEDSEVERICHEHGVYTYDDAREVTFIKGWFIDYWPQNQSTIKKFDELKYFTGLTSIEISAFQYCTALQSVTIPDGVTSIEKDAFYSCKSLQSIIIPNSVTSIGNYTFYNCVSLQSVRIPNSVTSIGEYAFSNCVSLQSVNIPDSVTSIGKYAFGSCESLQSINIPNSVTEIGYNTFQYCTSLQSVRIPNSVTSIGENVFYECNSLQSIVISKDCPVYNKIKEEYPNIQLVEPSVNESNLGLSKRVSDKFNFDKKNKAVENLVGMEFVDLSLPSGTQWAKWNIGAEKPEEYGDYFLIGDKNLDNIAKNHGCQIPSIEDFKELWYHTKKKWASINGHVGFYLTSKFGGESLFFPTAGYESEEELPRDAGKTGFYMTNTNSYGYFTDSDWTLRIISDTGNSSNFIPIRGVLKKKNISESSATNLGLAKKTRQQAEDKDAIDTLSPFVDLGLPSGTLWSKFNLSSTSETDEGEEYTFNDALAAVKAQYNRAVIPDDYDVEELTRCCKYKWTEDGMLFTSKKNGNQILIPKSMSAIGEDEWAWIWTSANSIRKTHRWVLCLFNPNTQEATSPMNEPYLDEASIENTFCVRPVIKKSEFDFDTKKA